jgi:hypothetical protein
MMERWIWVHKKDSRIKGAVGFVTCDADIADALLKEGKAQDPRVGAHHLKEIDYGNKPDVVREEPSQETIDSTYSTKVMTPEHTPEVAKLVRAAKVSKQTKKVVAQ